MFEFWREIHFQIFEFWREIQKKTVGHHMPQFNAAPPPRLVVLRLMMSASARIWMWRPSSYSFSTISMAISGFVRDAFRTLRRRRPLHSWFRLCDAQRTVARPQTPHAGWASPERSFLRAMQRIQSQCATSFVHWLHCDVYTIWPFALCTGAVSNSSASTKVPPSTHAFRAEHTVVSQRGH